jgi:hypothetical protein
MPVTGMTTVLVDSRLGVAGAAVLFVGAMEDAP